MLLPGWVCCHFTVSKSLQVTLKHEQVDGWHSGRAADGKDCAYNLQKKGEKHQQELTRICGGEKKKSLIFFFSYSIVLGIFGKDEREATKVHK